MAFPQRSPRPEDHAPSVAPATYQHTPLSNHVRPPRSTSVQSSQAMNTPPRHQMPPGASYPDDMLRHQAEEQQSIYRDPSAPGLHEYEGEEYHNPNPRKRINTEANENPKKRAAVACNICRGRKSKCDGGRPRCRLCTELNADCIYQEPGIKLDAGDKMILERLDRIEGFLQLNWNGGPGVAGPVMAHQPSHNTTLVGNDGIPDGAGPPGNFAAKTAVMYKPSRQDEQVTLMRPIVTWPRVQDLISAPFDPQSLLELELQRATLDPKVTLSLDFSANPTYIRAFFEDVAVWNASVNPYDWEKFYEKASRSEFREGPESCFVLLVLALGAASCEAAGLKKSPDIETPGMLYFSAAWGLLSTLIASHNILSSQCTILACNYLLYLVRPLEAWTLLSSTIPRLQVLLGKPASIPREVKELSNRIYWNAVLIESSCLASLDLPASGLSKASSSPISLYPTFFQPELYGPPRENSDDHPWFLTALVTLHQLNEEITVQTALPVATQGPIATDLNTRLSEWYTVRAFPNSPTLPPSRSPLHEPTLEYLRTQYSLTRMRIFRPYILSVLTDESMALQPILSISLSHDSCLACLDSAMRVLEALPVFVNASPWHKWQSVLAAVDAALIVMAASRSPNLSVLLPHADHVNTVLDGSVQILQSLGDSAPSLARAAEVVRVAEQRRRELVGTA